MKKIQKKRKKKIDNFKSYQKVIVYTSIPFQMAIIIILGTLGGLELDKLWNTSPLFTIILVIISVVLALYIGIKDFL